MRWFFPVPAAKNRKLVNSYYRKYIPGTSKPYQRGLHGGIDIGAPWGSHIRVVHSGLVVAIGTIWGVAYGKQILMRWHTAKGNRYAFYAHLSSIAVNKGDRIERGEIIGRVGNTGQVTDPHLHFELHSSRSWNQGLINPYGRLERARAIA